MNSLNAGSFQLLQTQRLALGSITCHFDLEMRVSLESEQVTFCHATLCKLQDQRTMISGRVQLGILEFIPFFNCSGKHPFLLKSGMAKAIPGRQNSTNHVRLEQFRWKIEPRCCLVFRSWGGGVRCWCTPRICCENSIFFSVYFQGRFTLLYPFVVKIREKRR